MFRRRLREGKTFEDFKNAWEAEKGFGVPTRVFNAVSIEDPRDVLTIGLVGVDPEQLAAGLERVAEHDFSETPREISIGSADSLVSALR